MTILAFQNYARRTVKKKSTYLRSNISNVEILTSNEGKVFRSIGNLSAYYHQTDFSFIDKNAGVNKIYYQLRITEPDGFKSYTAVRRVDGCDELPVFTLSPNPTQDFLYLNFFNSNTLYDQLKIISLEGKIIQTKIITGDKICLSVSNLTPGKYFILVTDKAGNKKVDSFIKN